jgi:hypothetical protein
VLLAGVAPGGVFEATAGRAGGAAGLGPIAERILHFTLDAPGIFLDGVHALENP